MSSNILLFDSGISSTVPSMKFTAGNDGTLIIQTTNAGGTATTALTINNNQQITFANAITPSTTNGIVGTTLADNANAGSVGEYVSSTVSLATTGATTGTYTNVTSISLTAGDWDVSGLIQANGSGTTTFTALAGSINTTSATWNSTYYATQQYTTAILQSTLLFALSNTIPTQRLSLSTTTTVYLVGYLVFATSTAGFGGTIRARRVR